MNFQIQQIQLQHLQMIRLSPHWISFIQFIQQHPFVTFEKLKFISGDPDWGEVKLEAPTKAKIKESVKF